MLPDGRAGRLVSFKFVPIDDSGDDDADEDDAGGPKGGAGPEKTALVYDESSDDAPSGADEGAGEDSR